MVAVAAFAVALVFQAPVMWIAAACALVSLSYLSFRYPDGRKSWRYSPRETVYTILTIISLCAMGALVNKAIENVAIPDGTTLIIWAGIVTLAALTLASLFSPSGRLSAGGTPRSAEIESPKE